MIPIRGLRKPAPATKELAFSWTPEREEQLRDLYSRGMSMRAIAREMGAPSHNSVSGKAFRMGLRRESI